jgi:simple sugar transport system ATP-binding protein
LRHFVESTGQRADLGKSYGNVHALRGVNVTVRQGEVTCVLGDNGTGKSTLIKIVVSGLHEYTEGTMKLRGVVRRFGSPRIAQAFGIATVHQDLALAPLMPVWRNFFLANEIRRGRSSTSRL